MDPNFAIAPSFWTATLDPSYLLGSKLL